MCLILHIVLPKKLKKVILNASGAPKAPIVGAITQPSCSGSESGSVVLTGLPSGSWTIARHTAGEDALVYYYGATTEYTVTGLSAGAYKFDVSDITYCTSEKTTEVIIKASGAPEAPLVGAITQPTCNALGSVVLSGLPSGNWTIARHTAGDDNLVYYYGSTSEYTVTGLTAGTYKFDVSDITFCTSKKTADVVINALVTPAPEGANSQMFNNGDKVGDLVAAGTNIVWYASLADAIADSGALSASQLLESGKTYYAMQTIGGCRSLLALNVTVDINALGVNKYDIAGLKYYPNPVIDFITISNTNAITSIQLFNLLGQHVLSARPNALTTQVDMSHVPFGTYLLEVQSEGKTATIKILKSK